MRLTKPDIEKDLEDIYDGDEATNGNERGLAFTYIVHKLLLIPKQYESSQRHLLFRARCTINGNVYEFIIDNRSTKNIISKAQVTTKLDGSKGTLKSKRRNYVQFPSQLAIITKMW